jgi:hypothetical protein
MVVPAGPHYLTTPAGSSRVPISVPAGFFFEGSDAVNTMADMVGVPIAASPKRADGFKWVFGGLRNFADASARYLKPNQPYDTVMVQYQDAVLPTIGSQATVDLKLDVVKMRSPETIAVTGSEETREYQVSLELRPYHQEQGRTEKMGSMNFTRTGLSTGKFSATFYAWVRYTFTPLDAGTPVVFDLDEQLTITVHDESPTRFVVPALYNPELEDPALEDPVNNTATGEAVSADSPCEGDCCCCQVKYTPGGNHCPIFAN